MKKRFLRISVLRVLLSLGLGLLLTHEGFGQAQALPDFTFYRGDGRPFGPRDLPPGKPVLFMLFDPTCPHCQRTIGHIGEQYKGLSRAEICLVSMDNWDAMRGFMSAYGSALKGKSNVVLLRDSVGMFIGRFKPRKYPAMMLFSSGGKLLDYEDNENTVFRLVRLMPN
jgi:AhpC/TSA family